MNLSYGRQHVDDHDDDSTFPQIYNYLYLKYITFIFLNSCLLDLRKTCGARGGIVVKALRYKPAGRGFDSRWCH